MRGLRVRRFRNPRRTNGSDPNPRVGLRPRTPVAQRSSGKSGVGRDCNIPIGATTYKTCLKRVRRIARRIRARPAFTPFCIRPIPAIHPPRPRPLLQGTDCAHSVLHQSAPGKPTHHHPTTNEARGSGGSDVSRDLFPRKIATHVAPTVRFRSDRRIRTARTPSRAPLPHRNLNPDTPRNAPNPSHS